jgi:uncharacterized protein with HEPN domain
MSRDWTYYLEDIAASSAKILRYTKDMDFEAFVANEQAFDAVIRNLEIVGEAAKQLPEAARALMPEIEWGMAAKFRDVIVHHYFGLDNQIVWDVVSNKMPAIFEASSSLLQRLRGAGG